MSEINELFIVFGLAGSLFILGFLCGLCFERQRAKDKRLTDLKVTQAAALLKAVEKPPKAKKKTVKNKAKK